MEKVVVVIAAYISEIGLLTVAHSVSNPFVAFGLAGAAVVIGAVVWFRYFKI